MAVSNRERWLAEPDWLEAHLDDPRVRIVDMRGEVRTTTAPDGTQSAAYRGLRDEYRAEHIPGALFLDWTSDIVDANDPVPAQVASPEQIAVALGAAGIGNEHTVVAYDSHPTSQFATRLWWVLRYYGHDAVKVLNGGLARWRREGRPLNAEAPEYPATTFTPAPRPEWRTTAKEVLSLIGAPGVLLADARDEGQYTNAVRRGARGGHIPGAINIPREAFVDAEGRFRSDPELREAAMAAGLRPEDRVIAYCNGGVAATTVLFGLSLIGYPRLANYDGSWNEWGNRPDLPVKV